MPAKRIEELEILIMQHEDSIESLSSSIHRQQLHIEKLDKMVDTLVHQLKSIQEESAVKPQEEEVPPPHY